MKNVSSKKKHRGLKIFAVIIASIIIVATILCIIFIDNKNIDYERFEIDSHITNDEEIKIAHLSDLHFPKIEIDIDNLVGRLLEEKPNIIAITGDLIDESASVESCGIIDFLQKINNIASVFYVYGNHEVRNHKNIGNLEAALKENNVVTLDNSSVNIDVGATQITLIGIKDNEDYNKKYLHDNINAKDYKILLAHRPEKWENYISQDKEYQPNLILTGHTHGGQVRLFGQGLAAPNQGLFPKYDAGMFSANDGNTTMIVSRGIGNSIFPYRFNNKPHVPIIRIK